MAAISDFLSEQFKLFLAAISEFLSERFSLFLIYYPYASYQV